CQNVTVQLNASGTGSITAAQVNSGSTDNCGISSLSVNPSTFTCASVNPSGTTADLLISEYVEGSGSNKYIEVYNGTGASVNLSGYQLRLYANGAAIGSPTNNVTLSGTLASGQTIVYRNTSATIYGGASTVNAAVNYNGDDAVALWKVSTNQPVDIFGVI